jgi:hypothetical protein
MEATTAPNRIWAEEESGVANPGDDGPLELPNTRQRVYALWAIIRGWSKSVYAPPSLSSVLGIGACSIPFMIVEQAQEKRGHGVSVRREPPVSRAPTASPSFGGAEARLRRLASSPRSAPS